MGARGGNPLASIAFYSPPLSLSPLSYWQPCAGGDGGVVWDARAGAEAAFFEVDEPCVGGGGVWAGDAGAAGWRVEKAGGREWGFVFVLRRRGVFFRGFVGIGGFAHTLGHQLQPIEEGGEGGFVFGVAPGGLPLGVPAGGGAAERGWLGRLRGGCFAGGGGVGEEEGVEGVHGRGMP